MGGADAYSTSWSGTLAAAVLLRRASGDTWTERTARRIPCARRNEEKMALMAKAGPNIVPCPAGSHAAVCCDVVDLGLVESNYAGRKTRQHKVKVIWQTDEKRDDGKPFLVSRRYTLSLHEKASLRKDLEAWRGRAFTEDELQGFDVEVLLGVPVLLSVVHTARQGSVYADVNALMRLPKGMTAPTLDPAYVRVCDRPATDQAGAAGSGDPGDWTAPSDDDVPF